MKKLIPFFAVALLASSCASHLGNISTGTLNGNVVYDDVAMGVAQTGHVLGIGGLSQDALVFEAKRDLMTNKPLTQGEQFTNFTVDFKHTYWLLYAKTKVTLTADVVRVDPSVTGAVYTDNYLKAMAPKGLATDFFVVGDSVILQSGLKAQIVQIEGKERVRISFKLNNGALKTRKMPLKELFAISKERNGLKVGGFYESSDIASRLVTPSERMPDVVRIAGLGVENVLIYNKFNNLEVCKYKK
jgi:hypothetical protein